MEHSKAINTIDEDEVAKFSAMAAEWWNPDGPFRPLHIFNPTRLAYIKDRVCCHFQREEAAQKPLAGLRILDIGCGGGLLSEPMTRLGATVVGADASEKNIKTASVHAQETGLDIDYRNTTAEALAEEGERFDVILNMEVIEHVADPASFLKVCTSMLKPGGLMFVATLNRSPKAYALAIVGAEYILRWLPRGTHDWKKFLKPSELHSMLVDSGVEVRELKGVAYNPLTEKWSLSRDTGVNYMMMTGK